MKILRTLVASVILSCIFFMQMAYGANKNPEKMPTLSEVEVAIWLGGQLERVEYVKWLDQYYITLRSLVAGDVAEFHDRLLKLQNDDFSFKTSSTSERMSHLYSWAVEADVTSISTSHYDRAIRAYDKTSDTLRNVHGGPAKTDVRSNTWRRIRANYYLLTRSSNELRDLLGTRAEYDNPNEAKFVDGYIMLLIARLTESQEDLKKARDILQNQMDGLQARGSLGQSIGRVALHLGRAHLTLASTEQGGVRAEDLARARYYAKVARNNLELLDVPIMWATSMALTSDVLDALARKQSTRTEEDKKIQRQLDARSDRAYELSVQYH